MVDVPELIPHMTWNTTVGDSVLVIKLDLTTSSTAVTNLPPSIIAIGIGSDRAIGRYYDFNNAGAVNIVMGRTDLSEQIR